MPKRVNEPIASWAAGDQVQGFALLVKKELRQDRNGKSYLDMVLADATASIAAKVWSDTPALTATYEAHSFVAFRGMVKSYREQLQIAIDDCREANDDDRRFGFEESLLIPSSPEDIDDLWRRLNALYPEAIEHPQLRRLAEETLALHGEGLRVHPAAKTMHHAYLGGLLEHTVSMAELAVKVAGHYPELDRDLLLLGVLFHDLGKMLELGAMPANDYTLPGRLVGHVVIGRDLLRERCQAIPGFPADLQLHLEHLVLSHQGRREYGAPVEPMTEEALVLHFIDDLDSKINQFRGQRRASTQEVQYLRGLGRYVYLRNDGETEGDEQEGSAAAPEANAAASSPGSASSPDRARGSDGTESEPEADPVPRLF